MIFQTRSNTLILFDLSLIHISQREHGSAQTQGRWAYTKRLNTELGKKIAGAIVRYAEENHRSQGFASTTTD